VNAPSLGALGLAMAANVAFFAALDQGMGDGARRVLANMAEPERVVVTAKRHEGEFAQCPGTKTL
jgi:hypothetical protein